MAAVTWEDLVKDRINIKSERQALNITKFIGNHIFKIILTMMLRIMIINDTVYYINVSLFFSIKIFIQLNI